MEINERVYNLMNILKEKYTNGMGRIEPYRPADNEEDEELYLPDEIDTEMEKTGIPFATEVGDAFESCGYECSVVVLAWYNEDTKEVMTTSALMEVC